MNSLVPSSRMGLPAPASPSLLPMADLAIPAIESLTASLESLARLRASTDLRTVPRRGPRMKGLSGRRMTGRIAVRRLHRRSRTGSCATCSKGKPAEPAQREREH
jgi:hypothetical protein